MWHVYGDVRSMWGLVRKPEGERPFRRSRRKMEYNIKMHNQENLPECVDLRGSEKGQLMGCC